ncbi:MAG: hypothetical protein QMD92_07880 [bacterium]|nr:hypothetical protein [bacterium]
MRQKATNDGKDEDGRETRPRFEHLAKWTRQKRSGVFYYNSKK